MIRLFDAVACGGAGLVDPDDAGGGDLLNLFEDEFDLLSHGLSPC